MVDEEAHEERAIAEDVPKKVRAVAARLGADLQTLETKFSRHEVLYEAELDSPELPPEFNEQLQHALQRWFGVKKLFLGYQLLHDNAVSELAHLGVYDADKLSEYMHWFHDRPARGHGTARLVWMPENARPLLLAEYQPKAGINIQLFRKANG